MNEEQKRKKLELETELTKLEETIRSITSNLRIGEKLPTELQGRYEATLKEWRELVSVDDQGSVVFVPLLLYQSQRLGVSIVSKDGGKHWSVITLTNVDEGHHDTRMTVEAEDGIPKRIIEPHMEPRFQLKVNKVYTIDIMDEQPKPEEPKRKYEPRVKLPSLVTCLKCGQTHLEDIKCPRCNMTNDEILDEQLKKRQEKHGFLTGIVEALKK